LSDKPGPVTVMAAGKTPKGLLAGKPRVRPQMEVTGELERSSPEVRITQSKCRAHVTIEWQEGVRGEWEPFGPPVLEEYYTALPASSDLQLHAVTRQQYVRYDARRTLAIHAEIQSEDANTDSAKAKRLMMAVAKQVPVIGKLAAMVELCRQTLNGVFSEQEVRVWASEGEWLLTDPAMRAEEISHRVTTVSPRLV